MIEEPQDDPELNDAQRLVVSKLSTEQLDEIDRTLLAFTGHRWMKVARVIGETMMSFGRDRLVGVPDIFYAERIRSLAGRGLIESQGNLRRMRFSEVRRSPRLANTAGDQ